MEETLKLILEKLELLDNGQKSLGQGQKSLEQRQTSLEQGQKSLEQRQTSLEQGFKLLEQRQANFEQGLSKLSHKVDAIMEQTAGLLEFKTEVIKQLKSHEIEIQVLKKAVAN